MLEKQGGGGGRRRKGAAPQAAAKPRGARTKRVVLHLGVETAKRLGVHAELAECNKHTLADRVLAAWLTRFGEGRALFGSGEPDPADLEGGASLEAPPTVRSASGDGE